MGRFEQIVSDFLCNINKEITTLRKLAERSAGVDVGISELIVSFPETGGSTELQAGDNIIDFDAGTITLADGSVEQLERSLQKSGGLHKVMQSFAIGADQLFHYKIYGLSRRIINAYHTDHVNNIKFTTVLITCNTATNIQVIASTHPQPDMGLSIDYKIDGSGKQYVLSCGSTGEPFLQCEHNKLRTLDAYHYQIEHGDRGTKVGHMAGALVSTSAFVVLANATLIQPASECQMEVVSDDVGDDAVGAGAQLVRIIYFNEAWIKKTTDVIMDGTTIVNTTATDIYRIESFDVIKGNPAIGTITLKSTDAATLYGQINPTTTFMERCMHYVETGERCIITDVIIGVGTSGGVIYRLFKSVKTGDNIVTKGRYSIEIADDTLAHPFNVPVVVENVDGDRIAVGLAVKGVVANQRTGATIRYYCEEI